MKLSKLLEYVRMGREIGFTYSGKQYWITRADTSDPQKVCFYEAYQPELIFDTPDAFIKQAMIGDEKLKDIWNWVEDIDVF